MAERQVRIWYDAEGDFLEVIFDQKPGSVVHRTHCSEI